MTSNSCDENKAVVATPAGTPYFSKLRAESRPKVPLHYSLFQDISPAKSHSILLAEPLS